MSYCSTQMCALWCWLIKTAWMSCNLQVTSYRGVIYWFRCYFTRRWSLWTSWVPSTGWRMLGSHRIGLRDALRHPGMVLCPFTAVAFGSHVHVSSGEAQPLAAKGWGFLPPWYPRSMQGPQVLWEVVLPIGSFSFSCGGLANRPLNEFFGFGQFFYNTWTLI